MSATAEQKAFHLQKMKARMAKLDVNKDGYITREDIYKMPDNLINFAKIPSDKAATIRAVFDVVADMVGIKPGEKKTVEEAAQMAHDGVFAKTREETREMVNKTHGPLFDMMDLNGDGHISLEEFKLCCKIFEYNDTDAEMEHSFNLIDTNKNGEISREEYLAATDDFLDGVEETEVSKTYCGLLM